MNEKNLGLGELLQLRGWITRRQLHRALALQRRKGGRLGSNLLEIGAVSEDQLLSVLAEQSGLPKSTAEDLEQISGEARDLVPPDLVRRRRAVPFRLQDGVLDVTVEDTRDLSILDEIAFAAGKRVRLYVSPEVRIHEILESAYGVTCPPRYTQLLRQLNQTRGGWRRQAGEAAAAPKRGPRSGDLWLASGTATERAPGKRGPEPPTKPPRPRIVLTAEERSALLEAEAVQLDQLPVEARLRRATRAQEVGEALVHHLSARASRCALLTVHHERFEGWIASGDGLHEERFRAFQADFQHPSTFLSFYHGVRFFTGPLPAMEAHRRFLACWNGRPPLDCAMVPVSLEERLVCVIYVDRLHSQLPPFDVADLRSLAAEAAKAFENCILRNRLRSERSRKTV
jgi:MshEN domain